MLITAFALKERHREIRDGQPDALRLRIHRALSWLTRSEQEADDPDTRFILQWIALNAAYAREFGREETERDRARGDEAVRDGSVIGRHIAGQDLAAAGTGLAAY